MTFVLSLVVHNWSCFLAYFCNNLLLIVPDINNLLCIHLTSLPGRLLFASNSFWIGQGTFSASLVHNFVRIRLPFRIVDYFVRPYLKIGVSSQLDYSEISVDKRFNYTQ